MGKPEFCFNFWLETLDLSNLNPTFDGVVFLVFRNLKSSLKSEENFWPFWFYKG